MHFFGVFWNVGNFAGLKHLTNCLHEHVFRDLSILFILSPGIQTVSICSGQDGKYSNLFAEDQTSIFSPPFLLNPFKTHNQASDHSIGNQYNFYITALLMMKVVILRRFWVIWGDSLLTLNGQLMHKRLV